MLCPILVSAVLPSDSALESAVLGGGSEHTTSVGADGSTNAKRYKNERMALGCR